MCTLIDVWNITTTAAWREFYNGRWWFVYDMRNSIVIASLKASIWACETTVEMSDVVTILSRSYCTQIHRSTSSSMHYRKNISNGYSSTAIRSNMGKCQSWALTLSDCDGLIHLNSSTSALHCRSNRLNLELIMNWIEWTANSKVNNDYVVSALLIHVFWSRSWFFSNTSLIRVELTRLRLAQ